MAKLIDPVIFVPGITATCLNDEYLVSPEAVWTVLKKNYNRITLHPRNLKYELNEPARVSSGEIFGVAYDNLIDELRHNLSPSDVLPVPVYPFSYDWRMPLDMIEEELASFVQEVIERTKLMNHYHKDGYSKNPLVNLVGHSMGGLVISGYVEAYKKEAFIHKVVTLATPYQGSLEAAIKIATGTANLGTSPPSSSEREAARLTPALYHLLPSFKNGINVIKPNIPKSLYNPGAWQSTVVDTVTDFSKRKGLPGNKNKDEGRKLFSGLLKAAQTHRQRIDKFKLKDAGLTSNHWLAVVGVNAVTRVCLEITRRYGKVDFALNSADRKDEWNSSLENGNRRLTGDGTVPYEGAIPKFLDEANLVCVTPDDFGYFELVDKALTKISGFHGMIPNLNMVQRLVIRFIKNAPDPHGNTWGRKAPGVTKWNPPIKLKQEHD